jgi:hypothetical protein
LEALGWLTVTSSNLEAQLAMGVWGMIDDADTKKGAAVTAGRTVRELADLYFSLAKMTAPETAQKFHELLPRIQAVNEARNRYVHSIWGALPGDKDVRFRFSEVNGYRVDAELAEPAEVRHVADDALGLATAVGEITQQWAAECSRATPDL